MFDRSTPPLDPAERPLLLRTLAAAGLPPTGSFVEKAGWVSRAWVGDEYVVRLNSGPVGGGYEHEARLAELIAGSGVPHARHVAHGAGPDGQWYVSERLPGQTLQEAWPDADSRTRRALVESLGGALHALHRIPVPADLMPPWLIDALAGGPWPAYHPPVVSATLHQVDAARQAPEHDAELLSEVDAWVSERLPLFADDAPALVHGDLHGSNVMVDRGRVTGLVDFAEALAQPADAELDTVLRWCARPHEFPATPDAQGLERSSLAEVPRWLYRAYPELFEREHLRERLNFYDMYVELAIAAHHPQPGVRKTAVGRIADLLSGHDHLDWLALPE